MSRTKRAGRKAVFRTSIKLGIMVIAASVLLIYFFAVKVYRGVNMAPFINDGQLLVISRRAEPERDDVVLYNTGGRTLLGRVIGLGGDKIEIVEGAGVIVNDNVELTRIMLDTQPPNTNGVDYKVLVDDGSYYLLNDDRADMNDSRIYGCISASDIVGVVVFAAQYRGF